MNRLFLSTPSARRATSFCASAIWASWNFYPRPPRGGRLERQRAEEAEEQFLSTPSARRATFASIMRCKGTNIFLSTPSARRATRRSRRDHLLPARFLSTPSARRATPSACAVKRSGAYFYPRPPRGGRPRPRTAATPSSNFYPRPPRGGRLGRAGSVRKAGDISIHALREEGDRNPHVGPDGIHNFYPRPPRGGRRREQ